MQRLCEDAKAIDWAQLNDIDDIDERVTMFNSLLTNLFNKHAPLRPVRVKQLPAPWLTDKIKGFMTKRDHAKYRYKKQPTEENLKAYKELRNRCNRVCRDAKRRYIHTSIENCDTSQLWNFLKTLGIGKSKANPNFDIDLSALNKHFSTPPLILNDQIRTEALNHLSSLPIPDCPSFNFKLVTGRDVKRCISDITSKAVGIDDISAHMIVMILDVILPHITNLINYSLLCSSFPSLWKKAFILPLPKVPNPTSLSQFRPISILPFLSKVLERLVFEQLSSYLSNNQLLNPFQSGFRPGHSTVTALIKVTDDIRHNIDHQQVTVLALLDFSNAFNSVDFELLLGVIQSLNVSPAVVSWFESYLKGRQQCVRTDAESSSWCPVLAGVPQGGVLSPLLFSLFINILANKLTSNYHLYADDLQLYAGAPPESLSTAVSVINENLETISKWVKSFGLLLNPSKSQAIILGSSRMLRKIDVSAAMRVMYDQTVIPYVASVKNLGVIMDCTLSWIPQLDAVSKKMFASFHSLKRLQYFLPLNTKVTLAQSLLFPILDYADVSYLDLTEELLNKLERLQNLCIRFIFGLRKYDHISEYRAQLQWLPIRLRRNTHILNILYSVLNNPSSPQYLKCKFSFLCSHSQGRALRHGNLAVAGRKIFSLQLTRRLFTDSIISLSGKHSIMRKSLVIYDDHGPVARGERMACSIINGHHRRKAVVRDWFGNGETVTLKGKVEMIQQSEYDPTNVEVQIKGLEEDVRNYKIHVAPVEKDLEFPCERTTLYDTYNPFNVSKSLSPPATKGTADQYELGDLGEKYGLLEGAPTYSTFYNDTQLALFGPYSVLGRSMVLHKKSKGRRWACSSIERGYSPSEAREIRAIASFHHPGGFAWGFIRMTQLIHNDGSASDTIIEVNLRHPGVRDRNFTRNHNWQIFVNPVGVDAAVQVTGTRCVAGGYRWNPYFTQLADPLNKIECKFLATVSTCDDACRRVKFWPNVTAELIVRGIPKRMFLEPSAHGRTLRKFLERTLREPGRGGRGGAGDGHALRRRRV
ncbi:unnamed protein product [Plutella xylostella]|uniref:(diamondback moth) hypothetical protein n=1 Tax=Plutella xylostella TaxID=51655 RepID=A0A8S4G683_PLUXY|nr:unnamed protein product [Plutella xylostella]